MEMSKDIFLSVLKNQSLDTLSKDIFNTICFDTCVLMPANNLAGDPVLNINLVTFLFSPLTT